MDNKFTKGPWRVVGDGIACDVGWIVGGNWHDNKTGLSFGSLQADKNLIAHAPQMFDLLEKIRYESDIDYEFADLIDELFSEIIDVSSD